MRKQFFKNSPLVNDRGNSFTILVATIVLFIGQSVSPLGGDGKGVKGVDWRIVILASWGNIISLE